LSLLPLLKPNDAGLATTGLQSTRLPRNITPGGTVITCEQKTIALRTPSGGQHDVDISEGEMTLRRHKPTRILTLTFKERAR